MKKICFVFVLFMSFLLTASPLSDTVGAAGSVNPYNAKILGHGPEAAFFNPALLAKMKRQVSVNTFFLHQGLDISLFDKPEINNVKGAQTSATDSGIYGTQNSNDLIYKAKPSDSLSERQGHDPSNSQLYGALGAVYPVIEEKLVLGVYAVLPVGMLQKQATFFRDEREANFSNSLHYELYEDRMLTNNVAVAVAGGHKWIYGGIGLTLISNAEVNAQVFSPDASKSENKIKASSAIKTAFMPHFGLLVLPWWKLQITLTAHLELWNKIDSNNALYFFDEKNSESFNQIRDNNLSVAYAYKPLTMTLGASLVDLELINDIRLSVAGTVSYKRWSEYLDRNSERPHENTYWEYLPEPILEDGIYKFGDWKTETNDYLSWYDTIDFTLGVTGYYKTMKFGLDLGLIMSPVPDQTGRTNYVDNDKIIAGAGYSYGFSYGEYTIEIGGGLQSQILFSRKTTKLEGSEDSLGKNGTVVDEFPTSECGTGNPDCAPGEVMQESLGFQTNNPGYPGYESSGFLFLASLWATVYF